jgi:hypothetical protein
MSDKGKPTVGAVGCCGPNIGSDPEYYRGSTPQPQSPCPAHGCIVGDRWVKRVWASRHLRRKPFAGWALDLADIALAEQAGACAVVLQEQEFQRVYVARLELVRRKGQPFDYGCGPQVCLALGLWRTDGDALDDSPSPETPLQLGLFGGGR